MLLGFKTKLKLNNKQRSLLIANAGVRRFAWNWGLGLTKQILAHNKDNPNERIKFPTGYTLAKWFVHLVKPKHKWLNDYSAHIPAECLYNLAETWKRCFKKTGGIPKFKKKGRDDDSFTIRAPNGGINLSCFSIRVPKIGVLKTYEQLPQVPVKEVTISRRADNWYVAFRVEVNLQPTEKLLDVVGVDLGILRFATLSQGEYPEAPRPLQKLGKKLSKLQWRNRSKQIGSAAWRKAQNRIARLHKHIADTRKTYIHGLTSYLAKNHSTVVIEDLNVANMMQNRKLAKAVSDCGFYEFKRQLEYKTELHGSRLVIADRWFPSSKLCSNCGQKKESLPLSERTYECKCGFKCDRDLNAAINLSKVGVLHPEFTPVDKKEPTLLDEAGNNQNTGS